MIKVNYISEISLPSHSGYTQHVLKICDAFSESYKTNLFLVKNNTRYKILQKNYLLKNKFNIVPFKRKKYNINFFLTATILVNENKTFNDNIYEFETKGIPFLASLGRGILKEFQEKKKGL